MLSVQKERLRPSIENQLEDVNCHHVTKLQELHKKVAATARNVQRTTLTLPHQCCQCWERALVQEKLDVL